MRSFAVRDIAGRHDLELLAAAATVCAEVGSADQQQWLYDQLAPHAGTHVVVGGCAAYHGAVDHLLGLLAAAQGHTDRAARHFTAAIEMHDRLGTPAWGELSRRDRDRLTPADVFRRDGDTWHVTFDGRSAHLADAKGLHDIVDAARGAATRTCTSSPCWESDIPLPRPTRSWTSRPPPPTGHAWRNSTPRSPRQIAAATSSAQRASIERAPSCTS